MLLDFQQSQLINGAESAVDVAARPAPLVSFSGCEPLDLPQSSLVASRHHLARSSSSRASSGCASRAINSSDLSDAFTGFDSSDGSQGLLGSTSRFLAAFAGIAHPCPQFLRVHQADQRLLIYRLGVALEEPGAASPAQVHVEQAVPFASAGMNALLTRDIVAPPLLAGLSSQFLATPHPRYAHAPSLAATLRTGC